MKNLVPSSLFALALLSVMFAAPHLSEAATKKAADTSAPVSEASAPSTVTVPVAPPPAPVAKAPEAATSDTMVFGDLTVVHPHLDFKANHIDIFLSIKNASKGDERLGGADTTWKSSGIVQVTKDKDGKETEGPVSVTLTAEKSVDLSTSAGTWLRMKDVQTEPKSSDVVPVTLYFRRSPNAVLKIAAVGSKSSDIGEDQKSSVMNWLKH